MSQMNRDSRRSKNKEHTAKTRNRQQAKTCAIAYRATISAPSTAVSGTRERVVYNHTWVYRLVYKYILMCGLHTEW